MNLDALLTELVARKGSDLFITVGTPPTLKSTATCSHWQKPPRQGKGAGAGQGDPEPGALRALSAYQGG